MVNISSIGFVVFTVVSLSSVRGVSVNMYYKAFYREVLAWYSFIACLRT